MSEDKTSASFGFREVPADDKARLVRGVFDSVASRYDLMNDLMSGGVHRIWKAALTTRVDPRAGETLLDVAGGTGDVALGLLDRAAHRPRADEQAPPLAIVCDINHEMLKAGAERRDMARHADSIVRVCGDAEHLPLPDKSVDAYSIAFGIRNVTDIDSALSEAYRVLRPGGRFFCLEFSHAITDGLQKAYDLYSFEVIPRLGGAVTGDRESYQYLVESIRCFPTQEQFALRIEDAGFSRVKYENFTGGVAAIHSGRRI